MRCPECDCDVLDESFGDGYETIYTCEDCGCVFKIDTVILKSGNLKGEEEE